MTAVLKPADHTAERKDCGLNTVDWIQECGCDSQLTSHAESVD